MVFSTFLCAFGPTWTVFCCPEESVCYRGHCPKSLILAGICLQSGSDVWGTLRPQDLRKQILQRTVALL